MTTLTRTSDGTFLLAQADPASPQDGTHADPNAHAAPGDATHAGTEQASGEHKVGFPPFSSEHFASQLIWLAITFGAMYVILSRYALPRIAAILAERQGKIDADLTEARRLKSESDAAIAAYEQALLDARANANKLAGEARDAVARQSDANRKTLEAALTGRLAEAEASIAQTKTAALSNVHGIATGAASDIVQHLIGIQPAPAELDMAVGTALSRRAS